MTVFPFLPLSLLSLSVHDNWYCGKFPKPTAWRVVLTLTHTLTHTHTHTELHKWKTPSDTLTLSDLHLYKLCVRACVCVLTRGQKAPAAAADDLALAAHVGEFRGLQRARLCEVNGYFIQAACCVDFWLWESKQQKEERNEGRETQRDIQRGTVNVLASCIVRGRIFRETNISQLLKV